MTTLQIIAAIYLAIGLAFALFIIGFQSEMSEDKKTHPLKLLIKGTLLWLPAIFYVIGVKWAKEEKEKDSNNDT